MQVPVIPTRLPCISCPIYRSQFCLSTGKEKNIRTFYLDSPEDIAVFKQQNQTFSIEGFVKDEKDNPITGASSASREREGKRFRMKSDYSRLKPITTTPSPYVRKAWKTAC